MKKDDQQKIRTARLRRTIDRTTAADPAAGRKLREACKKHGLLPGGGRDEQPKDDEPGHGKHG